MAFSIMQTRLRLNVRPPGWALGWGGGPGVGNLGGVNWLHFPPVGGHIRIFESKVSHEHISFTIITWPGQDPWTGRGNL